MTDDEARNEGAMMSTAEKKTTRGFRVPCICCGDEDGVRVSLDDVSQFSCTNCDAAYDEDGVRAFLSKWEAVLAWCEAAPVRG